MFDAFFIEYKYLLATLLSVILGFLIGLERKTSAKEAGVRTHTIVCFGACLLMVISKYGFEGANVDVSRVASQIVSGIGFIGAGIIVYRKNAIHGLTTAAGIWATAWIGMACGAGLYFVAIGGTVIMICVQCVLHINCKLFSLKHTYRINISFIQTENEDEKVKELFGVAVFNKVNVNRGEKTIYNASILTYNEISSTDINEIMNNNDYIIAVEICDD